MSVNRVSAHRREMRTISFGKIEQPVGTSTEPPDPSVKLRSKLSQYIRADEAPVAGSQYSITLSRSSSRDRTCSGCPSQSVHAQNFSTTQAHWPAGESTSP